MKLLHWENIFEQFNIKVRDATQLHDTFSAHYFYQSNQLKPIWNLDCIFASFVLTCPKDEATLSRSGNLLALIQILRIYSLIYNR